MCLVTRVRQNGTLQQIPAIQRTAPPLRTGFCPPESVRRSRCCLSDGLVERQAEARRRVEYSLTDLGRTLVEPIEVLTNWARDYGGAIADFQEASEAATSPRARTAG